MVLGEKIAIQVNDWFETKLVHSVIVVLVFVNAIIFGLDTIPEFVEKNEVLLRRIDLFILTVFIIEMIARMLVTGRHFFKNYWNVFDLIVISCSLIPADFGLGILRSLRILHSLSTLDVMPKTRHMIEGLARSVPGLLNIILIVFICFYTISVIATDLYREEFPEQFGTLWRAMYTLFAMVTTGDWASLADELMPLNPNAWFFLVLSLIIIGYLLFNLVVGAIVHAMHEFKREEKTELLKDPVLKELKELRSELKQLKAQK